MKSDPAREKVSVGGLLRYAGSPQLLIQAGFMVAGIKNIKVSLKIKKKKVLLRSDPEEDESHIFLLLFI